MLARDLIPDFVPIIGGLDDVVVVVLAVDLFLDGVPTEVLDEKIERWASTDGRSGGRRPVRRFMPGPIRRALRGAPRAVAFAGDTLDRSRIGPRIRTWINKEESLA